MLHPRGAGLVVELLLGHGVEDALEPEQHARAAVHALDLRGCGGGRCEGGRGERSAGGVETTRAFAPLNGGPFNGALYIMVDHLMVRYI